MSVAGCWGAALVGRLVMVKLKAEGTQSDGDGEMMIAIAAVAVTMPIAKMPEIAAMAHDWNQRLAVAWAAGLGWMKLVGLMK
jgi:uncharacterized membrane protein YbjE (DUF340 family)